MAHKIKKPKPGDKATCQFNGCGDPIVFVGGSIGWNHCTARNPQVPDHRPIIPDNKHGDENA